MHKTGWTRRLFFYSQKYLDFVINLCFAHGIIAIIPWHNTNAGGMFPIVCDAGPTLHQHWFIVSFLLYRVVFAGLVDTFVWMTKERAGFYPAESTRF